MTHSLAAETDIMKQYYTAKEAAGLLMMHPRTINRYIRKGYFGKGVVKGLGPTSPYLIPVRGLVNVAKKMNIDLSHLLQGAS